MIGADMGSIDVGPYALGSGRPATPPRVMRRDLALVLVGARRLGVPLLIGSAGTAGARPHLDATLDAVREIARAEDLRFRLAWIPADIDRALVHRAIASGRAAPLGPIGPLTADAVDSAAGLVGQMGTEAFQRALDAGADVVIAGRACDTAIFAALPARLGFPVGPVMHMAKIVECTSLCCEPGGRDAMLATLTGEGFELESMSPARRATPRSVAAHALYEQDDPFEVHEPEGTLDLTEARYEAIDDRRVRVSGARWRPRARPTVKIEGAARVGARAVLLAGAADPAFIGALDMILPEVERVARSILADIDFSLHVRRYGLDGVVAWPEPPAIPPREILLLVECVAPSAEAAHSVLAVFRQHLLHHGFPGRRATGGNLAFPLTPPELGAGDAYRFVAYHTIEVDDLPSLFPVHVEDL
jgi:hypothetical protein